MIVETISRTDTRGYVWKSGAWAPKVILEITPFPPPGVGWVAVAGHPFQVGFDGTWAWFEGRISNAAFYGYWGTPFPDPLPEKLRPETEKFFPVGTDGGYTRAVLVNAAGVIYVGASAASATPWAFDAARWRVA